MHDSNGWDLALRIWPWTEATISRVEPPNVSKAKEGAAEQVDATEWHQDEEDDDRCVWLETSSGLRQVSVEETVNKDYYHFFLWAKLCPARGKKRADGHVTCPLILHDNTSCHTACVVTTSGVLWKGLFISTSNHSPNRSPPDYGLCPVIIKDS